MQRICSASTAFLKETKGSRHPPLFLPKQKSRRQSPQVQIFKGQMNTKPAWTDIRTFNGIFCSSVCKKHTPTKKAQRSQSVIPGQDQGSHLNENTKACESTMQVQRLDSWSQPGMTVLLHLQFHIVLLFLFTKVELILSASQMHNIEWTNVRQARLNAHSSIQWNLLFLCSSVFKMCRPTKKHSAHNPSSLARTRDLISMETPKPARTQHKSFLVPVRNDCIAQ